MNGYEAERSALGQIADMLLATDRERRPSAVRDLGLVTAVECDPESLRPIRAVGAYLDRRTALERARERGTDSVLIVPLLFDPRPLSESADGGGDGR